MGQTYKDRPVKTWADDDYNDQDTPVVVEEIVVEEAPVVKEEFWETTNLPLAAAITLNFELQAMYKGEATTRYGKPFYPIVYRFIKTEALLKVVNSYWNDTYLVNPIAFYRHIQHLRSQNHDLINN